MRQARSIISLKVLTNNIDQSRSYQISDKCHLPRIEYMGETVSTMLTGSAPWF